MNARGAILGLLLAGCYASHAPMTDGGTNGDAPACVELGPVGCLIDRSCWCYSSGAGARCVTCRETCTAPDCECVRVGGVPGC